MASRQWGGNGHATANHFGLDRKVIRSWLKKEDVFKKHRDGGTSVFQAKVSTLRWMQQYLNISQRNELPDIL